MSFFWRRDLFVCVWFTLTQAQDCKFPPPVKNANIFPTSTKDGAQADYFCDPGFYTFDLTSIICFQGEWRNSILRSQTWLIVPLSEVEGKLFLPTCTKPIAGEVHTQNKWFYNIVIESYLKSKSCKLKSTSIRSGCGNPPLLTNGAHVAENPPNFKHVLGAKITYVCVDGFYLNAPEGAENICLGGNRWSLNQTASESFPICEPVCKHPPKARNATVRVFPTTEQSIAQYVCDEGLSTNDITTFTCSRDGIIASWNITQVPECNVSETGCGNPPFIKHGYAEQSPPFNEGDVVTYRCFHGYELIVVDSSQIICRGSWITASGSRKFPYCRPGMKTYINLRAKCEIHGINGDITSIHTSVQILGFYTTYATGVINV
ncbi:unnamed protein product [Clavelina lepadiformis]|uniref:Sushi domain-containing protein n=1 Tax=Clavelina lepadiformis TaxID=159417 RepID=A0ABP0G7N9_CLALP